MPQRQIRNKRRAESDSAHAPALATLANLAACKRHHPLDSSSLSVYSLAASQSSNTNGSAITLVPQLTFDARTRLPPADIVEELLSHMDQECNIISKIVQPKKLVEAHRQGKICAFLLLAVLANNALFSSHPAIVAVGTVPAVRALVDRAKAFVPDALEKPSVSCCQAVLLLSVAYMHLGMLDVSSHYSSMSLRLMQQLGVCKIDDNAWTESDEWISEPWLEREQIRRLVWGGFTMDTFLAMMLHTPPYVFVDLSGVNRPCPQNIWYIGNDNLDAVSFPESAFGTNPGDSEYLTTLKKLKLAGMPWQANGTTLQLNFSVLGNAILRGISDPQFSQDVLDKLVLRAFCSLAEWIALVPPLPEAPSYNEVHHTMLISSVALVLKSVITPYLISHDSSSSNNSNNGESPLIAAARATARYSEKAYNLPTPPPGTRLDHDLAMDWLLKDYISTCCQVYRYMRRTQDMMTSNIVPPMFAAHTAMISGGVFAACAHTAPTEAQRARFAMFRDFIVATCRTHATKSLLFNISLTEIKRIEEMVRFIPRRLEPAQLTVIREKLIPGSIEALVNKRFSVFIQSLLALTRISSSSSSSFLAGSPSSTGSTDNSAAALSLCPSGGGGIPLTSNLCAIFGRFVKSSSSSCAETKSRISRNEKTGGIDASSSSSPSTSTLFDSPSSGPFPNYKLSFAAISSLMIALTIASKDESFLDFVPELRASATDGLPTSPPTTTTQEQQQQQHQHQQQRPEKADMPIFSSGFATGRSTASAFAWSLANRFCNSMASQSSTNTTTQEQQQLQGGHLPPPSMSPPQSVRSAPTPPPPPTMHYSLSPPLPSDAHRRPSSQKPPKSNNLVDLLN
ncbi:hypothetical protein LPJ81_000966 [Coemansia sp. IMI 209127]|nr:hypothetical protein LPJ81_000966 [Coemansia sp. IMI 209127]